MRYDPKDADKVVFPKGWYNAELVRATDETSKQNNPMLHIVAKVFSPSGGHVMVDDYIVATVTFHVSRLKHLCEALGLPFEDGEVDPSRIGGDCKVYVTIQEDAQYGDKNRIQRYAATDANVGEAEPVPAGVPTGDDIPF